jgi:Methyltransferase domain
MKRVRHSTFADWLGAVGLAAQAMDHVPMVHDLDAAARYGIVYGLAIQAAYRGLPEYLGPARLSSASFEDWTDPIDLYYEDAVHVDPILAQNLAFWTGRLKLGGIICGDDYRPRFPDVRRGAGALAERCGRELIRVDFFWCLLPDERTRPGSAAVVERWRKLGRDSDAFKQKRGLSFSIGPSKPIPPIEAGDNIVVPCRVANDGLDAWPTESDGSLGIGVRIVAAEAPGRMLAESRVPMSLTQIEPDVPSDIYLVLPTATLPPGSYRAVFDLLGPEGRWVTHPKLAAVKGNLFDVGEGSTVFGASTRRKTAHKYSGRARLLDEEVAARDFVRLVFADSHGAFEGHLGAGLLYYSLGLLVRSQVSVCVGSGGGFVPSLMRRAQLDAGIDPSVTYLVDANLPELAFGSPIQSGGWMTDGNAFLKRESDILILPVLSVDAAKLFASEGLRIDYLHVDGDHSKPGFLADVRAFAPLLADTGIVTFHDVRLPGVAEALSELRRLDAELEILTFPEIGAGTGVLRRRVPVTLPRRAQTGSGFVDASRKTTLA